MSDRLMGTAISRAPEICLPEPLCSYSPPWATLFLSSKYLKTTTSSRVPFSPGCRLHLLFACGCHSKRHQDPCPREACTLAGQANRTQHGRCRDNTASPRTGRKAAQSTWQESKRAQRRFSEEVTSTPGFEGRVGVSYLGGRGGGGKRHTQRQGGEKRKVKYVAGSEILAWLQQSV